MAGIKNIRDLYKKVGEKGLREVLEGEIRVTEKFDAYRFAFEKNPHNYKIYFYGKNGKAPLSKIDRTVNDLYEAAISYIENLPADIKKAIPVRHRFGFSWFPTQSPLNTEYSRKPKHGLVLTDITIRNRQWEVTNEVKDNQVFDRWSKILGVEPNTPVFEGRLDEKTVDSLLEMAKNDYTLSSLNESAVHTEGLLKGGIEALVFETDNQLFKVESVLAEEKKAEKRSHLFDILLLDICEHISSYNITGLKTVSMHPDEAYIEIVSEVFNDFVEKKGTDFLASGLERPRFLEKSGKFNRSWIKNPKTLSIIENNSKYEYLYTVFLTNLRKPKYPSGLLNEAVTTRFNNKIEEIDRVVSDDLSFLEFNSILREGDEPTEEPKSIDMERAVLIMQNFFGGPRQKLTGKEPVNIIICNCGKLTNDIVGEAERLFKMNGLRTVLVHDGYAAKRDYFIDKSSIEKMLNGLVAARNDVFLGYKFWDKPFILHIFKKLYPEFFPAAISAFTGSQLVRDMEFQGIKASQAEYAPSIEFHRTKGNIYTQLHGSLERDSYREFCVSTPECVHPFWPEIKSAFDRYTYR
jgi:hypothetical protein